MFKQPKNLKHLESVSNAGTYHMAAVAFQAGVNIMREDLRPAKLSAVTAHNSWLCQCNAFKHSNKIIRLTHLCNNENPDLQYQKPDRNFITHEKFTIHCIDKLSDVDPK